MNGPSADCPENRTSEEALPGAGRERDRESGDGEPDQRRENHHAPFHVRPEGQGDPADGHAEHGGDGRHEERPAELSEIGMRVLRQIGHREGESAEPGPGVKPDEDQGADAGREQAGKQGDIKHRPAHADDLHQQEGRGQRRAEQGGDGGETSRRPDHRERLGRHVPPGEMHGQDSQAGPQCDERRFWSEHRAQRQSRQRREEHAGDLGRGNDSSSGVESVGR